MKAHENVAMYCIYPKNTVPKRMKDHRRRLKAAKPMLAPTEPKISPRAASPSKITDEIKPGPLFFISLPRIISSQF
jgi:hypothetical protein